MTYPKPLSEKKLAKMYEEAGIDEEKKEVLRKLFDACAHLYGIRSVSEIWDVYRARRKDGIGPVLHRRDVVRYSAIARREEHIYRIYEIDELYSAETRKDTDRMLVNNDLIGSGYNAKYRFYDVDQVRWDYPAYIPEDILSFTDGCLPGEYAKFIELTGNLSVKDPDHPGAKLKDVHRLGRLDAWVLKGEKEKAEKNPARHRKEIERLSRKESLPAPQRIAEDLRMYDQSVRIQVTDMLRIVMDDLNDCGAQFKNQKQAQKLLELLMHIHNRSHHWYQNGWTPEDLGKAYPPDLSQKTHIRFGPEVQKQIREGKVDKEELRRRVEEMGMIPEFDMN